MPAIRPVGAAQLSDEPCAGECSWLFAGLEAPALQRVRALSRRVRYRADEIVFQEGEPTFGYYLICTGKLKLSQRTLQGKRLIFKVLGPGDVVGEQTLFGHERHTCCAETLEPAVLHFIEKSGFVTLLRDEPKLALGLIDRVADELKTTQDHLVEQAYQSSPTRLVRRLLALAARYGVPAGGGVELAVPLARTELAELAGLSTETAIRLLSHWKQRGWIGLKGHRIIVHDQAELSRVAGLS